MKIHLHLGAHKTGSTFIQDALKNNQAILEASSVKYIPLSAFREGFTKPSYTRPGAKADPAARQNAAAAYLRPILETTTEDLLILSDENLLGVPSEVVSSGTLYPNNASRLSLISEVLQGYDVKIFLCVRHLAEFGRSIFSENLRFSPEEFTSAEEFREKWLGSIPSWVPVVDAINVAFPGARVVFWNFKVFREDPQIAMRALTKCDPPEGFSFAKADRRPGLSHRATEELLRIGASEGGGAVRRTAHAMRIAYPLTADNWTYKMWQKPEIAAMQAVFTEDLKTLQKRPNTRMIKPAPKAQAPGTST